MFQPLTLDELPSLQLDLVKKLRERTLEVLPTNYDHSFNFLRWIVAAEKQIVSSAVRTHEELTQLIEGGKHVEQTKVKILSSAEAALRHHFQFRSALRLDDLERRDDLSSWDRNPMYTNRLLPRGDLCGMDKRNRIIWLVDYGNGSNMTGILHSVRSGDLIRWHFWAYETLLQLVVEQERKSGRMSSIYHIGDLGNYVINPFSSLVVSSGQLSYYGSLFHYEHYPELVTPMRFIKVPRCLYWAYKLFKSLSPVDIFDRISLCDSRSYHKTLTDDISPDQLPAKYGGVNAFRCVPAELISEADYYTWDGENEPAHDELSHVSVGAQRRAVFAIRVNEGDVGAKIEWYFKTDGVIYFGGFWRPMTFDDAKLDFDRMQMIEPNLRLLAKLVPERGVHRCERAGLYYFVFWNRFSWISTRNVCAKFNVRQPGNAGENSSGNVQFQFV